MAPRASSVDVLVESGKRRVFAGALDWPGWCRSGRDEISAIEALLEYGPRYARALQGTRLGFAKPGREVTVRVLERLEGTATTDFGAPDVASSRDADPMDDPELRRSRSILKACWATLDAAAEAAEGRTLGTGPRGGGRKLDGILDHVLEAEQGYLVRLSWRVGAARGDRAERVRGAVLEALAATATQGVAPAPRGGKRWTPRFFVRRVAWHALDHAWEIEDRLVVDTE